ARLGARLSEYNDSIAEEAAHQRRIRNWTIKDRSGREWGINERGPVVAGRNLPIPVPLPVPRASPELEEEARDARRQRDEINRQAEDVDRDRNFRERTRATRARQDSIRNARRGGTTP
ncbi:MAG TPA: hypothetical protein VFX98_06125, partial [Longimicrobiaceae bacterium]|nr:hypothetical protein [Longimicrobiaceae bacterium]